MNSWDNANGNRTHAVVEGETFVGTYDAQDRLLSYGDTTYTYNNHGTLAAKTQGDSTTAYTYDARGSLLAVAEGTNTISYSVDPMGRRIAREKNGETTHKWLYQGFLSPIAELDAANNLRSRFVYATRANVPDYMIRDGQTYRLITDIRGSVRMVVNAATGETVQRMDYDEWGNVVQDTNPGFQPFGFAGGLYDPDTALVRFGYRDYDPSTGRWTAKDPILFGGGQANLYLYCDGDSINFIDPTGEGFIVGAFIGAAAEFVFQVAGGLLDGKGLVDSVKDVNYISVGISAVAGATGFGVFGAWKKGKIGLTAIKASKRQIFAQTVNNQDIFLRPATTFLRDSTARIGKRELITAGALGATFFGAKKAFGSEEEGYGEYPGFEKP